jgi:hypothetical protein
MKMNRFRRTVSAQITMVLLGFLFFPFLTALSAKSLPLHTLKLPDGFSIEVYADNVPTNKVPLSLRIIDRALGTLSA